MSSHVILFLREKISLVFCLWLNISWKSKITIFLLCEFSYEFNFVHTHLWEREYSDETIRIQNFPFSQKWWWKNCWKLPKLLRCRKAHSLQTIKDIDTKFISIAQIKDLNKICVKISRPYLITFQRNKPSKCVTIGPGQVWPVHRFKWLN